MSNTYSNTSQLVNGLSAPNLGWLDREQWVNDLMDQAPDAWDGDEAMESIALDYVHHLELEVRRLGGCLLPYCGHEDKEPCDHGYRKTPEPHPGMLNELREIAESL